jgi:hypothetical protein
MGLGIFVHDALDFMDLSKCWVIYVQGGNTGHLSDKKQDRNKNESTSTQDLTFPYLNLSLTHE